MRVEEAIKRVHGTWDAAFRETIVRLIKCRGRSTRLFGLTRTLVDRRQAAVSRPAM
jgi:hypothetical protein